MSAGGQSDQALRPWRVTLQWPLLLGVLALALVVRLWVIWSLHFDGLYGQDAYAYFYHGTALWHDHTLSYPWPWLPHPLRLYWPLGEPALVALAMAIAGHSSAVAAQAVSIVAGMSVVAITYLLTQRVASAILPEPWAAWSAAFAGALIALSGLQVQASDTIMADAPALCWASAAVWLWTIPCTASPQRNVAARSALAGVCFAMAVSTRFEYAPLIVAMALYWLALRHRGAAPSCLAGLVGAALAGIPQALYSLSYSDPVLHQQWLTSWNIQHLWQARFVTRDGVQHYPTSVGTFYLLRPLYAPQSLPFLLAPFLVVGIIVLHHGVGRRAQGDPRASAAGPLLLLLLAWWLVPALYLSGVPFESARFALIYAPPLAILEAVGLVAALRGLRASSRVARTILLALAVLSLGVLAADTRRPLHALADGKVGDLAVVRWLSKYAPRGATLVTFSVTLTLYHNGDVQGHRWTLVDLSSVTPADLRRLARTGSLVVIANEANLATQWPGLPPEVALRWLLGHTRLRQIISIAGYTIRER